jgi:hypothetical protein
MAGFRFNEAKDMSVLSISRTTEKRHTQAQGNKLCGRKCFFSYKQQNAQEMPLLLRRATTSSRGCGHRRTGIVANRGGSSYSEKGAENEGVRDRCILQRTTTEISLQGARTIPASAGNSEVFSGPPEESGSRHKPL